MPWRRRRAGGRRPLLVSSLPEAPDCECRTSTPLISSATTSPPRLCCDRADGVFGNDSRRSRPGVALPPRPRPTEDVAPAVGGGELEDHPSRRGAPGERGERPGAFALITRSTPARQASTARRFAIRRSTPTAE